MKYLILLIFSFLLFACTSNKKVYWCGDHACINNKEKESYFKKTMTVEVREFNKKEKKNKSELEIIKKQAEIELKKEIQNDKKLAKQVRLEEKRRIKEAKELEKQARLEEKRRIKEAKELKKQVRLEEKKLFKKEKKILNKKIEKTKNIPLDEEASIDTNAVKNYIPSSEFVDLVEKINKKNMFRPYPNINDIPN